jgi:hypothetical protein
MAGGRRLPAPSGGVAGRRPGVFEIASGEMPALNYSPVGPLHESVFLSLKSAQTNPRPRDSGRIVNPFTKSKKMTEPASPTPTPEISEETRLRIFRDEQVKRLSEPMFGKKQIGGYVVAFGIFLVMGTFVFWTDIQENRRWGMFWTAVFAAVMTAFQIGMVAVLRIFMRARIAQGKIAVRTEELQEKLDENFFTNLVKINFKYIDKYYLQTQVQANKSFLLSCFAALVSFGVVIAGIVLIYRNQNQETAGYVAAGAGCLGQFVSAIFFYLYNETITKMAQYHQKLVLTQNIGLALKITEDLQGESKTQAQIKLIETLTFDINRYLTGGLPAAPAPARVKAKPE